MAKTDEIRNFLIQQIALGESSPVAAASECFSISRQAANRHLKQLIAEGLVIAEGQTRSRKYRLRELVNESFTVDLTARPQEDKVWREQVRPLLDSIPRNVLDICQYGFTEILNNAIEHSEGKLTIVEVVRTATFISMSIADDGVGIFNKIKRELNLEDERHAILELAKGKLTTDPLHHSGEGIFFTSRVFDQFSILSGNIAFIHSGASDVLLDDRQDTVAGTAVYMRISVFAEQTLQEVFDRYANVESDYGFSRTVIPVALARYGDENLVSRSQAKRLLHRVERFQNIVLDFDKVNMIGQAFADEIFRVFQREHPQIQITWTRANPEIENMIRRAQSHIEPV